MKRRSKAQLWATRMSGAGWARRATRRPWSGAPDFHAARGFADDRLVVLRRVDVARNRTRHRDLGDLCGVLIEQAPDALVAMELRELAEHAARKRDRMPATVVVAADREWRIAATGEQHRDRRGGDTGLVTEHQHDYLAAWIERLERRRDRRRAAGAVGVVYNHIRAREVDLRTNVLGAAADRHHELVEPAGSGERHDVPEQRAAAVGEELFRRPESTRTAGAEDEPGDEGLRLARRHAHARPRTWSCSLRSRSRPFRR